MWNTTHAAVGEDILNWFLTILIKLIMWIIELVGSIVLWEVTLLIDAAKYNNFVKSTPVVTGWVLVRDVANMFFIVVLLVIAFSTIIGYKTSEFGVKQNLPRLLLFAILINFSKTLVGLMIDFSEVVMLTFVNGFQQAAGGNFVNALKLNKILALSEDVTKQQSTDKPMTQGLPDLLGAAVLGLTMLMISASVILALIIYLLFRIVGLWILLILSPMAFFALALPGKLQKGLNTFTGEWWSKLTAMLVGGPVVAFFLWLSLATVQGGTSDGKSGAFADIYPSATTAQGTRVGISQAGNPPELASFVVAIVMLLAGLQTALQQTQAISNQAFQQVQKAKGLATKVAARTAKAGVRVGVGAAVGTARFADQRIGLSKNIGKGLSSLGQGAAQRGGIVGAMFAPSLLKAGASVSGIHQARQAKLKAETEESIKKMTPESQAAFLKSKATGATGSLNFENKRVFEELGHKQNISKAGQNVTKSQNEKKWYKDNNIDPKIATGAEKRQAKAYADAQTQRSVASSMDALEAQYRADGKTEEAGKIADDREKNPALFNDLKDLNGYMTSKNDFKDLNKSVNIKSLSDSAVAASYIQAAGDWMADGKLKSLDDIKGLDTWKEQTAKNPKRAAIMEQQIKNFHTEKGAQVFQAHLDEMNDVEGAKPSASMRYRMTDSGPMSYESSASTTRGASASSTASQEALARHADVVSGKVTDPAAVSAGVASMMGSGVPMAAIVGDSSSAGSSNRYQAYQDTAKSAGSTLQSLASLESTPTGYVSHWVENGDDAGKQKLEDALDVVVNLDTGAMDSDPAYADNVATSVDIKTLERGMSNMSVLSSGNKFEKEAHQQRVKKYEKFVAGLKQQAQKKVQQLQEKVSKDSTYKPSDAEKKWTNIDVDLTGMDSTGSFKGVRAAAKRGAKAK